MNVRISYPDGREEIIENSDAMSALEEKFPEAEVVCNGGHCWIEDEDVTADEYEADD